MSWFFSKFVLQLIICRDRELDPRAESRKERRWNAGASSLELELEHVSGCLLCAFQPLVMDTRAKTVATRVWNPTVI